MNANEVYEKARKDFMRKGKAVVKHEWASAVVPALKDFLDHIEEFYSIHENSKGDVLINLILWDGEK